VWLEFRRVLFRSNVPIVVCMPPQCAVCIDPWMFQLCVCPHNVQCVSIPECSNCSVYAPTMCSVYRSLNVPIVVCIQTFVSTDASHPCWLILWTPLPTLDTPVLNAVSSEIQRSTLWRECTRVPWAAVLCLVISSSWTLHGTQTSLRLC
jgi:hypothetical protein